jgi:hypothetical protein
LNPLSVVVVTFPGDIVSAPVPVVPLGDIVLEPGEVPVVPLGDVVSEPVPEEVPDAPLGDMVLEPDEVPAVPLGAI